ncbi:MAG: AI-2E family transporter [bacterium]|nr:AI-2E family transporter [bacterium]
MNLNLSERQQSTVASAVTVMSSLIIIGALGSLVWLLSAFLRAFSNVFLPLAIAGVTALVLKPFHAWFVRRLRFPPVVAVFAVFFSILLPLIALGAVFGALIVDQVADLIEKAPAWWENVVAQVQVRSPRVMEIWQKYQVTDRLQGALEGKEGALLSGIRFVGGKALSAGVGIFSGITGLLNWVLFPIYVGFLLLGDIKKARTWSEAALPFLKPETRHDIAYLVEEFIVIIVAFFRGQLLVALLQGIMFAVGFQVAGLRYGVLLGLVLGFLNIVPYLGSIVGLGIALPLAFFQEGGGWWTVFWVMVVFTVVQMVEGYFLTPKIMGDRTGLHPMVIMIAMFFWASALNGISGMILAIPLTAFFVVFWRLARDKYIRELV